jgi:hypothetical protein
VSFLRDVSKAAWSAAPDTVKARVERAQRKLEARRAEAEKAFEDFARLEQRALEVGVKLLLFPWATAGAIRELYGRVRDLEGTIEKRDEKIRLLEDRIRQLESGR